MKTTKSALFGILTITALAVQIQAQSFLTNGLVAYYPFNGNTIDASGNANNLTNYGATPCPDRFGNANHAFYFNGMSNHMSSAPNDSALPIGAADRTLSLWVKADSIVEDGGDFVAVDYGFAPPGNTAFGLLLQYDYWKVHFLGVNQDVSSGIRVNTQWHQAVCIYSSGNAQFFLDGIQCVNTQKTTSTLPGKLVVGEDVDGSGEYFAGSINDIRIYNRALSTNEVAQLYAIESSPPLRINKAIYLSDGFLTVGSKYQVQASSDFVNWTNSGLPFTAAGTTWTSTNYWNVANWDQLFFRLQVVP
jgi:hypothetical protein